MLKSYLPIACALVCATGADAAGPKWPAKIIGQWKGNSNQSPIVLSVTSQTVGSKVCNNISGAILDVNGGFTGNMIGFYCPASGNVEFMRYPTNSSVPYQVYNGNLSQADLPPGVHGVLMAGVYGQYSLTYGPLGQASFSLTK